VDAAPVSETDLSFGLVILVTGIGGADQSPNVLAASTTQLRFRTPPAIHVVDK